jgi:PKD repeat protein
VEVLGKDFKFLIIKLMAYNKNSTFFLEMKIKIFIVLACVLLLTNSCKELNEIEFIPLTAAFTPTKSLIQLGEPITFQQQSTVVAKKFEWDFGDGNKSTESSPSYTYPETGLYTVKLKVTKADNVTIDDIEKQVRVLPPTEQPTSFQTYGTDTDLINGDEFGLCFRRINANIPQGIEAGYIFVGRKNLNTLYIVRTNLTGDVIWSKDFSVITRSNIFANDVIVSLSGNEFVVVGYFDYQPNDRDAFILSMDKDGNRNWLTINATGRDEVYESVIDIGPVYLTVGNTRNITTESSSQISLDVYSKAGILESNDVIGTSNWVVNDFKFIQQTGEFLVAATESNVPLLIRYSTISNEITPTRLPIKGKGLGIGILGDPNDRDFSYILVGELITDKTDSTNAFVARIDRFGNVPDNDNIDKIVYYQESLNSVATNRDSDSEFTVVGTHFNPLSKKDVILLKYKVVNDALVRENIKLIGGTKDDQALQILSGLNDKLDIFGTTSSFGKGFNDFYFFQVDKNSLE